MYHPVAVTATPQMVQKASRVFDPSAIGRGPAGWYLGRTAALKKCRSEREDPMQSTAYSRRFVLASAAGALASTGLVRRPVRAAGPLRIRVGWVVVPADLFPLIPAMPHVTKHHGTSYVLE